RTSVFSLLGLMALTAALTFGAPPDKHDHHAKAFEDCAKACGECALACDSCAHHCANMLAQGKKEHHKTLRTCQDCATHCGAAACITGRHGVYSDLICKACAEACKRCGDACDQFKDDAHMKKCADECRKCEKACREMLKHTEGTAGSSGK